jgi:hypothetical protein
MGIISKEFRMELITQALRETIIVALSETVHARLTIDTEFLATTSAGERVSLVEFAIIESKSRHAPTVADRTLWRMGFRPIKLSKFGTSLAALDPTLPSNRWTRALKSPWVDRVARTATSA